VVPFSGFSPVEKGKKRKGSLPPPYRSLQKEDGRGREKKKKKKKKGNRQQGPHPVMQKAIWGRGKKKTAGVDPAAGTALWGREKKAAKARR